MIICPGAARIKKNRQRQLRKYLEEDPFLTDEDLAGILSVSVQTIRLDRQNLHIPELRERVKSVARGEVSQVRTLVGGELVGGADRPGYWLQRHINYAGYAGYDHE